MSQSKPSSRTWRIVHIYFPLLPFLLEGILKWGATRFDITKFTLDTFSAPTLAMSIGLLCMFVNQSLQSTVRPISSPEQQEEIHGSAILILICSICSFVLFAVLIMLSALAAQISAPEIRDVFELFELITFSAAIFPIGYAVAAQKSYKLKASI